MFYLHSSPESQKASHHRGKRRLPRTQRSAPRGSTAGTRGERAGHGADLPPGDTAVGAPRSALAAAPRPRLRRSPPCPPVALRSALPTPARRRRDSRSVAEPWDGAELSSPRPAPYPAGALGLHSAGPGDQGGRKHLPFRRAALRGAKHPALRTPREGCAAVTEFLPSFPLRKVTAHSLDSAGTSEASRTRRREANRTRTRLREQPLPVRADGQTPSFRPPPSRKAPPSPPPSPPPPAARQSERSAARGAEAARQRQRAGERGRERARSRLSPPSLSPSFLPPLPPSLAPSPPPLPPSALSAALSPSFSLSPFLFPSPHALFPSPRSSAVSLVVSGRPRPLDERRLLICHRPQPSLPAPLRTWGEAGAAAGSMSRRKQSKPRQIKRKFPEGGSLQRTSVYLALGRRHGAGCGERRVRSARTLPGAEERGRGGGLEPLGAGRSTPRSPVSCSFGAAGASPSSLRTPSLGARSLPVCAPS